MWQIQIKEKALKMMRKPGNLSATIIFFEQQYGSGIKYHNKVYSIPSNDSVYFLSDDGDFANILAEALTVFTQLNS